MKESPFIKVEFEIEKFSNLSNSLPIRYSPISVIELTMVVQFKLAFTAKFGFKTLIPQDIAKNSISGTLFKNISGLSGGVMEISEYKSTRVTDRKSVV